MTIHRRVLVGVAAGALAVGGCGMFERADDRPDVETTEQSLDIGSSIATLPTTAPASASTTVMATAVATTAAVTTTTVDVAAEEMQIEAVFLTFFGGAGTDVDAKVAVLQDGERYRGMLEGASADAQFQSMSIDIRGVRLLTPDDCAALGEVSPCAVVTHDLFVGGAPALVGQDSAAVRIDGRWKVAASAWCRVVAIGGAQCP